MMTCTFRLISLSFLTVFAAQLGASPALAGDKPEKRTLTLAATGTVKATPDKVDISTGVTSEASSAREALDQNTEAMAKVVDALKGGGIKPEDIQTTNFSVQPVYDRRKERAPVVVGYRVTNSVRIALRDTAKLGEILDEVVTLGANEIGSIEFGVAEPEALKDKARQDAMAAAIANAKLYAEAAGVELGPVLTITEEESFFQPRAVRTAARMEAAAPVPIEAGTASVEVRIRVTWELK